MIKKKFKTVEISNPAYEQDGLRFITVKTPNLKGRGDICVFVPEGVEKINNLPIYILLHGVYGSSWIWSLKGGVHQTAAKLIHEKKIKPCILAMPSDGLWGDGSAYSEHSTLRFDNWIVEDVISAIRQHIPQAKNNKTVCIGGLSMGGYGALRLGALYSPIFSAISAHSSITRIAQMINFVEEPLSNYKADTNPLDLVDVYKSSSPGGLPPIRFDCGQQDELFDANELFSHQLGEMGVHHKFECYDGGHEWSYWEQHVGKSLIFFDNSIKTLA